MSDELAMAANLSGFKPHNAIYLHSTAAGFVVLLQAFHYRCFPWGNTYWLSLWSQPGADKVPAHVTTAVLSHFQKNSEFGWNCEMLGKLGTLFSSITASSSGSKDFPYTSPPSTQLTSLWSYCKASKKVGSAEDSHVSACLMVTALWY